MATRPDLFSRLARLPDTVEPGLAYSVAPFAPDDAEGVAALFYRVYGESYPIDMYYDPEAILHACERGALYPVVARLSGGEVVGFASLYASSPPFPGLMELGLGMVHPAYRGSLVLFHLYTAITERMQEIAGVEAVFGEAVCDTIITQHASSLFGFRETALELDLMPGSGPGRIACLVMTRNLRDVRRRLYVPPPYAGLVAGIVERAGLDREVIETGLTAPDDSVTRIETATFPFAKVMRTHVFALGGDGMAALSRAEEAGAREGCRVFQVFLNLAEPGAASAVPGLRRSGYVFGGLMPRWFNDDALLMQKHLDEPAVAAINLYSDPARELLAAILADRQD